MFWVHQTVACWWLWTWDVTTITSYLRCRSQFAHFSSCCLISLWKLGIPSVSFNLSPGCSWEPMDRRRFWNFLLVDCCAQSTLIHQQREIEWKWSTCQSRLASHHLARFYLTSLCLTPASNLQARLAMDIAQWARIQKLLWHDVSSVRAAATKPATEPTEEDATGIVTLILGHLLNKICHYFIDSFFF